MDPIHGAEVKRSVYDVFKASTAVMLRDKTDEHGAAEVGVAVEGVLAAITAHLRLTVGPEAAFNVLTRHADAAILPALVVGAGAQSR